MPFDNAVKDNKDIQIPSKHNRFFYTLSLPGSDSVSSYAKKGFYCKK